jgi:hypothetical protein
MDGLLGGLLGYLQDPRRTQQVQGIGNAIERGLLNIQQGDERFRSLADKAFDPQNPGRILDREALKELTDMTMGSLLGFAPVGMAKAIPIQRGEQPIQGAVVKIGDKLFLGRTHGDALNRAIYEGVVRKEQGKYIYPKDQDVNADLFMTKEGNLIDRWGALFDYDIGGAETAIEKGLMQNTPARSMDFEEYKRQFKLKK